MVHICVSKLNIIGSDNDLLLGWHWAIIWTNAGILLIGPLGTNLSEILIPIHRYSFKKMHLKMSSGKWRPFRLGPNVLIICMITSLHGKTSYINGPLRGRWICWSPMDSPHKGPALWCFHVSFVVSLNKVLDKQSLNSDLKHHAAHVMLL